MTDGPAGTPPAGPFRMRYYWLALAAIVLLTLAPLVLGMNQAAAVSVPLGTLALVLWAALLLVSRNAHARRSAGPSAPPLRVNFFYYAVALVLIGGLGYATFAGWLPSSGLLLVAFVAIFWLFSFVFALVGAVRKPKAK